MSAYNDYRMNVLEKIHDSDLDLCMRKYEKEGRGRYPEKEIMLWLANINYSVVNRLLDDNILLEEKTVKEYDIIKNNLSNKTGLYNHILNDYLDNIDLAYKKGLSFIFYGPNETGKTFSGCHVLAESIFSGYSGYYIDIRDYVNIRNKVYFNNVSQYQDYLNIIEQSDFLVLDELGKESTVSDAFIGTLEHIIKTRSESNLPTILISNLDIRDKTLEDRYGYSVLNALFEQYKCFQFSKRGKFRQKNRRTWEFNEN